MFPHSNTIYAVHELRRQEYLREAARERLAALAIPAARSRLTHVAASDRLHGMLNRMSALLPDGTRMQRLLSPPVSQSR